MSLQLGNFGVEANLGEQGGDFRAQSPCRGVFFVSGAAQNVPYFLLHAAAIPFRAALQPCLDSILNVTDNKLGHHRLLAS